MANRRMFAKTVIDSDAFLEMSLSTQALYFHLAMRADDDGFVNNPKKIMRMIGANEDEIKVLLSKKFILIFESGVIVIKHWKLHNYIQKDRYKETVYLEEKKKLLEKDNGSYTFNNKGSTQCIQNVSKMETQVRLVKDRLGKSYIPDFKKIISYLNEKSNSNYRHTTKKTQDLIKARFNEGFEEKDFISVIDKKVAEWKGGEMERYLRPETLFGTKFEGYLNQNIVEKKNKFNNFEEKDEWNFDDLEAREQEIINKKMSE